MSATAAASQPVGDQRAMGCWQAGDQTPKRSRLMQEGAEGCGAVGAETDYQTQSCVLSRFQVDL
jgi:hypothetical protein